MSGMNDAPVIAIPVKDEAERIGECLRALAQQDGDQRHEILLLLNDCSDRSAAVVREIIPELPVSVHLVDVNLPARLAHAGGARAFAMEHAVAIAGAEGVVMTTDADGRVYHDWVAANLHYLRNGWDAVAGKAEIDPIDAALIPRRLQDADAIECDYAAALDEIAALLDPDAADPWPRHDEHSGASIAVTVAAFHDAGGVPPVPLGEDRAFFDALRRTDARIRHAPEVRVMVSGRIIGRAQGGMADTIRRRLTKLDETLDDRLEPAEMALRRLALRRRCRAVWVRGWDGVGDILGLAECLQLSVKVLRDFLMLPYFGSAWAAIEERSPSLTRQRVSVEAVADEMARGSAALETLRRHRALPALMAADRHDAPLADAAE